MRGTEFPNQIRRLPIKSGGSNRCTPLRNCRACVTSNCHEAHGQGKLRISQQLYSPLYQWNENISTSCSNLLSLLVPFGPFSPLHISTICTLDALQSWVATRSNMNKHLSKCLQAKAMNFQHLQCQHDGIHSRHENPANESHFLYDWRASTRMPKKNNNIYVRYLCFNHNFSQTSIPEKPLSLFPYFSVRTLQGALGRLGCESN